MTNRLEKKFSKLHSASYGVFTNSGTSALQVAIHTLKEVHKWKDGDEVIVPAVTFVATINVVLQNKLKPVFVDVWLNGNIDTSLIEPAITSKTRAIIPVHLLGKPADMDTVMRIAKKHKLKVIEDACETILTPLRGDISCFSFYVAHLLVTGVGGMAITNNERYAKLIRSLIFHGRDNKYLTIDDDDTYNEEVIRSRFKFNHPGYSYRATEMEAALGLVGLENVKRNVRKRRDNYYYMRKKLEWAVPLSYVQDHACMFLDVLVYHRNDLIKYFEKRGVATRTMMPLINQPYIKKMFGDMSKKFPTAAAIGRLGLLIGCHEYMSKPDMDYIVELVKEWRKKHQL
jgi:dTDP-4-amino-4,6-dideoxygalactose transaminase